jgi:hypothetical protein
MRKRVVLLIPTEDFELLEHRASDEDRGVERQAAHLLRRALRELPATGAPAISYGPADVIDADNRAAAVA